jgi:hypothetical protein
MSVESPASIELEEWKAEIETLYSRIEGWLSEMKDPPRITRRPITINERISGPYSVDELFIEGESGQLAVRPVARWVLGADGRVDLIGTEGPEMLIRLRERDGWYYLAPRFPFVGTADLRPLDGESFRKLVGAFLQ